MREIVEWLCPVCQSEYITFRKDLGGFWLCINCHSLIPADMMFEINYMRQKVKHREAEKRKRLKKSKEANK